MVLASLLFATMGVGVKIAARSFSITELVFYRRLVSVVFIALLLRAQGVPIRTPVPMMHAWRRWSARCRWGPGSTPSPTCRWPQP